MPLLVLAGDWCRELSFEGCAVSAIAAVQAVVGSISGAPAATATEQEVAKPRVAGKSEYGGGSKRRRGRKAGGWAPDK